MGKRKDGELCVNTKIEKEHLTTRKDPPLPSGIGIDRKRANETKLDRNDKRDIKKRSSTPNGA